MKVGFNEQILYVCILFEILFQFNCKSLIKTFDL